jgi:glycosyltransferase involved in cell wall biosynthesis
LDILDVLGHVDVQYRGAVLLVYFGYDKILSKEQHDNKCKLFEIRGDVRKAPLDLTILNYLRLPYYRLNFVDFPEKYDLREDIDDLTRRCLREFVTSSAVYQEKRSQIRKREKAPREKPVFLIYEERFAERNAMFRSFSRRLATLRGAFEVHVMTVADAGREDAHRATLEGMFDAVHFIEPAQMGKTVLEIEEIRPDIMLFPSIGLTNGSLFLSTMRFCDVQIMGLGVLSAPRNDEIDFIVASDFLHDADAFNRHVFVADGLPFTQRQENGVEKGDLVIAEAKVPAKKEVRVGYIGTLFKINHAFLSLLKECVEESSYDLKFTFIMDFRGLQYVEAKYIFEDYFGDVEVFPFQPYEDYFNTIKRMDMFVNPFPFGHTHTLVDGLMNGKPCVSMDGKGPHGSIEAQTLRACGLDGQFLAKDRAAYKAIFLRLVEEIAAGKRDFFDPRDVYAAMYEQDVEDVEDVDYAGVYRWILAHKDVLKSMSPQLVAVGDDLEKDAA